MENVVDKCDGKLHIVMFPWLAFGHMIPYLELSKLIAKKGHKISFVSTPRNIDRLPKLPSDISPNVNFVKLSLPKTKNLPEDAEATTDLPYDSVKYLKIAYDGLQEPLTQFLEISSPVWIVHDFTPYWLKPITDKLKIKTAFFSIFIAAFTGFMAGPFGAPGVTRTRPEDFIVPPNWVSFDTTVAFKYFEIMRIFNHSIEKEDESLVTDAFRLDVVCRDCDVLAIRSSYEFEPEWLKLLETIHNKPVIPVGQLPTTTYDDTQTGKEWEEAIKPWLDQQSKGSVIYIAFGSEAKPSQAEVTTIALGLEKSKLPFFWVLRKQRGYWDTELIDLPQGFEDRMKGRGVVCTSWAPQFEILSHESVGGFLTHSGWSSVVEAIQLRKVLILLTFLADQGINSRLLEEKVIGYPIPRDDRDGLFTSDAVAESLRLVMLEDEGKKYRDKVTEMSVLFGDIDMQDRYVDNLLDFMTSYTKDVLRTK